MLNEKTKRCFAHDYHERCICLVTVSVEGRKLVLGQVADSSERAWLEPSALGRTVWTEIGRKAIQHVAEECRLPLVQPLDNGLPKLYKPYGEAFYPMSEGRLLQPSPFAHHPSEQTITRQQCTQLNLLAEPLANQ